LTKASSQDLDMLLLLKTFLAKASLK